LSILESARVVAAFFQSKVKWVMEGGAVVADKTKEQVR
jgi:hypothetical protein